MMPARMGAPARAHIGGIFSRGLVGQAGVILPAVLVLGLLCWMNSAMNQTATAKHAVCLVLGKILLPNGSASDDLQARLRKGVEVVQKHGIQNVIFSGGDTARLGTAEALVMKEIWDTYVKSMDGAAAECTMHEEVQSLSTCQNAFYSLPILKQVQATHIYLVTSDFHVARTKLLFEQVFKTLDPDFKVAYDFVAAPTRTNRTALFENERKWLQPKNLEILLTEMKDHPFLLPDADRIEQARKELDSMERS